MDFREATVPSVRGDLARIRAVALDVDGVLTDDAFVWGADGEEFKRFTFLDVMGISRATGSGITFALISGEASPLVDRFAAKLGIQHVWKGTKDKASALSAFAETLGLGMDAVAFIGNDINDLDALRAAGFAAAPSDAHPSVRSVVHLVSAYPSGRGAVRDFLDRLAAARTTSHDTPAGPPALAPDTRTFLQKELTEHLTMMEATFVREAAHFGEIADVFTACFKSGGKLMFCGNGGSAADAQHIAAEFINRFRFDRAPLPALALTVDSSVLTCIGNDAAFEQVFAKQVEALARPEDVLVGISTSGRSANVLLALEAGRRRGATTVGFTGDGGTATMSGYCDFVFAVASHDTARIQEAHEFALHSLAALVECRLYPQGSRPSHAEARGS